jgi:hypothetical protein
MKFVSDGEVVPEKDPMKIPTEQEDPYVDWALVTYVISHVPAFGKVNV